jgi:hypothetical protein
MQNWKLPDGTLPKARFVVPMMLFPIRGPDMDYRVIITNESIFSITGISCFTA